MKPVFALWVGPTWREKDPKLLLRREREREREGSKENWEWKNDGNKKREQEWKEILCPKTTK